MSAPATTSTPSTSSASVSQLAVNDVFHGRFSEAEQRALLAEDLEAQTGVSMVLGALVFAGMLLGITSVLLIFWLQV